MAKRLLLKVVIAPEALFLVLVTELRRTRKAAMPGQKARE